MVIPRYWEGMEDVLEDYFVDVIKTLLKDGYKVVLTESNHKIDSKLNIILNEKFKENLNFSYRPIFSHDNLETFFELINASILIISMRMHPIIIASICDIKSIAIDYKTPKIKELMNNLGQKKFLFSLDEKINLNSINLNEGVENDKLQKLIELEKGNTEILIKFLNE